MKKILLPLVSIAIILTCFFDLHSQTLVDTKLKEKNTEVNILKNASDELILEINFPDIKEHSIATLENEYYSISMNDCKQIHLKGMPDLPKFVEAIALNNKKTFKIDLISSEFKVIDNIKVAPSKGPIYRTQEKQDIPYIFGLQYELDEYYPLNPISKDNIYQIRNAVGQNLLIYPVQYNPIKNKIKVYEQIVVKLSFNTALSNIDHNPNISTSSFNPVLSNHFLNYNPVVEKYTPTAESDKKMLIISHQNFIDEMMDFIEWKRSIGFQVELVNYATIGSSIELKKFVKDYYDTNGLTYLLLVGDYDQVPSSTVPAGHSDNRYGHLSGNDSYQDIFIGRFSGETDAQILTQVDRTVVYEKETPYMYDWTKAALGIAFNEGGHDGLGDDGESGHEHMDNIKEKLENYGYKVYSQYEGAGSQSGIINTMHMGVSLINYDGHGKYF